MTHIWSLGPWWMPDGLPPPPCPRSEGYERRMAQCRMVALGAFGRAAEYRVAREGRKVSEGTTSNVPTPRVTLEDLELAVADLKTQHRLVGCIDLADLEVLVRLCSRAIASARDEARRDGWREAWGHAAADFEKMTLGEWPKTEWTKHCIERAERGPEEKRP